jgi:membrane protein
MTIERLVPAGRRRAGRAWATARTLTARSVQEFFADGCPQRAAAISYYGLLSLFPLVILVVGALGVVLDSTSARDQVIDFVLDRVPLRADAGRRDLRDLLAGVTDYSTGFGVIGAVGLLVAATGVMGAIRHGLNAAWDVRDPRPPLIAKLVDLLLVLGFGLVATASLALSLLVRFTASAADTLAGWLGTGLPVTIFGWVAPVAPVVLSLGIFAGLYRIVPARRTTLRDSWPGVLVATAGFEAAKAGFSLYLANFSRYEAIYASLGSVIAFLVFCWLAANVLLLGAEVASEHARLRREPPADDPQGPPLRERVKRGLRSLVVRQDDRTR